MPHDYVIVCAPTTYHEVPTLQYPENKRHTPGQVKHSSTIKHVPNCKLFQNNLFGLLFQKPQLQTIAFSGMLYVRTVYSVLR